MFVPIERALSNESEWSILFIIVYIGLYTLFFPF